MIELLGAVGWGLLACGAASHLVHYARFRELLALHLDHEKLPAMAIVASELFLVVAIPVGLFLGAGWLTPLAIAAGLLGLGFVVWIARLLLQDSVLPCACSFSAAPTSQWSLLRASCVLLVVSYAFVATDAPSASATSIATLAVGLAVAAAIFVMPEALGWPPASKALMQRVDAFQDSAAA